MISTKGRYALRMMIEFARLGEGDRIPLRTVADKQGISMKYLEQIASMLVQAGILESARGPRGGYRLAKRPEDITTADILEVVEGGYAPVACLSPSAEECPRKDGCETLEFWKGAQRVAEEYFSSVTLADFLEEGVGKGAACPELVSKGA